MPFSPLRLLLLAAALVLLITVVQLGLLTVTFDRLGLSAESAYLLLLITAAGSAINLPLFTIHAESPPPINVLPRQLREMLGLDPIRFTGKTIIAVNVGGCVTPAAFSLYLLQHNPIDPFQAALAIGAVAIVAYATSSPTAGVGISMPFLVAPLTAALVATMLSPENRAPLAYVGGTLGVLVGADLLRLRDIGKLGAPVASIGGAGTFDGIFLTGLLAVLLA